MSEPPDTGTRKLNPSREVNFLGMKDWKLYRERGSILKSDTPNLYKFFFNVAFFNVPFCDPRSDQSGLRMFRSIGLPTGQLLSSGTNGQKNLVVAGNLEGVTNFPIIFWFS